MRKRVIDYYDLIELPSGKHVPVPIAIKEVGLKNVLKIPVSRKKKRGYDFYWCEQCQEEFEAQGEPYMGDFFKCKIHRPPSERKNKIKIAVFKELIRKKQYYKLKYIEVKKFYGYTGGWFEVKGNKITKVSPFGKIHEVLTICNLHSKAKR